MAAKERGDVIELQDGRRLLNSMEFGGDGNDFATTRLVAHESADGGRTWGGQMLKEADTEAARRQPAGAFRA